MRALGLSVAAAALAVCVTGCVRDAVGECPDVDKGQLVVTELRGPQSDMADTLGVWVELYNASSQSLDLDGVKLRYRTIDGGTDIPVIVRRSLTVAAGAYVVLGLVPDEGRPEHIDYGFSTDFKQGYLAAAAIDVLSCDTLIDRVVYSSLPKTGTYSLGAEPTADNNDVLTNWCTNDTSAGTPKAANPACP